MITTAILYILFGFLVALTSPLRLFDDVSLPADLSSSLASIGGYFGAVDEYIPITTLLAVFIIFAAIEGYIFVYKGVKWVRKLGG